MKAKEGEGELAMTRGVFGWPCQAVGEDGIVELDASKQAGDGSIEDIRGLKELEALQVLDLSGNELLTSLTGLEGLENLRKVYLNNCTALRYLTALVENSAFATGDVLDVTGCDFTLMCGDIAILKARGVSVTGDTCQ